MESLNIFCVMFEKRIGYLPNSKTDSSKSWMLEGYDFGKANSNNEIPSSIGATKVARSSEISDRGHFVANFVYLFHIFSKKYLNIF